MAMDSIPLQASLIAWSSAHLSRSSKPHIVNALEGHSVALAQVSSSICTLKATFSPSTADTLLASCLVLSATEIVHGDTEHWYKHLKGAKEIIMAAECVGVGGKILRGPGCFAMERDGQWLLRNFAYHDVLGSVTSNEGPLISGAYWLHDEITVVDSYVGVGSKILAMLSDICKLDDGPKHHVASSFAGQTSELQLSDQVRTEFWQAADELEFRLQEWKCPDASDDGLIELAESYRGAAFISPYRKQRSRSVHYNEGRCPSLVKDKIATAVQRTMSHIQKIPLVSLPECGLLFPLFMAGGDTLEASHIEIVRSRLHLLLGNRRFGNIARASEVLEEFWRLRITGVKNLQGRDLDWKDILREKGWHLTLV
jgi:transcriptional activator protein UGA3